MTSEADGRGESELNSQLWFSDHSFVEIGRNFSGIHWRSDYQQGLLLGEAVAISLLRDRSISSTKPSKDLPFTRFDKNSVTV